MPTPGELRIEPSADILTAARTWLEPVRAALEQEFVAAYLTGSVLNQGFDATKSRVNVLVISRVLHGDILEALVPAIPASKVPPRFEPLFMTRRNIEKSLDSFPIEWLEIQERHLLIEGEDVVATLRVPQTFLRLQCEHELRGKHIQLRQAFLASHGKTAEMEAALSATASGMATLFRTLLRLQGEPVPATAAQVIERIADVYELDVQSLLAAHLVRYGGRKYSSDEMTSLYRKFLGEIDRLINAIDQLQVP